MYRESPRGGTPRSPKSPLAGSIKARKEREQALKRDVEEVDAETFHKSAGLSKSYVC